MADLHTRIEICLVLDAGASAPAQLDAILREVAVASVLIRPAAGQALAAGLAKSLIETAQRRDAAALVQGDAGLARALRADGVHLPWSPSIEDDYAEARDALGPRGIVGVSAGALRHAAMALGEAGADYIGFDVLDQPGDLATAGQAQLELVAWWAEIFQVPCVAFGASDPAMVLALASAGADFVGLAVPPATAPADAIARVVDLCGKVGLPRAGAKAGRKKS